MEHILNGLQRKQYVPKSPSLPPSVSTRHTLLSLTPDLLRETAFYLPPSSRLNFALTCRTIYKHVWDSQTHLDLTERFPIERKLHFSLSSSLPASLSGHALRKVPRRANQQHVHIAVSSDGVLVATIPYDNRLRLIDMATRQIVFDTEVFPLMSYDAWNLRTGRQEIVTPPIDTTYADASGLDVEIGLEFSADDGRILVSGGRTASIWEVCRKNSRVSLRHEKDIRLDGALLKIMGHVDYEVAIGGAATLSPNGEWMAWMLFCREPACVFLTIWEVGSGECRGFREITTVHPRRLSSLAWARAMYTPNGKYLMVVVNSAKQIPRVERRDGEFRRLKLCRFVLGVYEGKLGRALAASSADCVREVVAVRENCEWVDMGPHVYAKELGGAVGKVLKGLEVHSSVEGRGFWGGVVGVGGRKEMLERGFFLNGMHSSPGEATYKAVIFGEAAKHPWLVTKQPMFSLYFGVGVGIGRVVAATSPHTNVVEEWKCNKVGGELVRMSFAEYTAAENRTVGVGSGKKDVKRRRQVFREIPWRVSFATVTAFSGNGRWIAGASLLDDDKCYVCLRNVTIAEYFSL